jgi:head-tail adaptor
MIGAGRRDTRIVFERLNAIEDDYGTSAAPDWTEIGRAWALVLYGTGAERRDAAQTAASMPATITVLANSLTRSLTTRDRLTINGAVWNIAGVAPLAGRAEVAITALRGQD